LLLGACAGAGWLGGTAWRAKTAVRETPAPPFDESRFPAAGMALGDTAARTVRVFGDYECDTCRELDRRLGDTLLALARAGRIHLVYHHSPLRTHPLGALAGEVAYCAAEHDAGWRVHRALYRTAPDWGRRAVEAGNSPALPRLLAIAVASGADSAAVLACIEAGRAAARVRDDAALARQLRILAVPTILVDSTRLEFRSFPALLARITRLAS
jgi:protein-disulfide isomerase